MLLLLALYGLLLLRLAQRVLSSLLFQLPPRMTRLEPVGLRPKSIYHAAPKSPAAARKREADQGSHALLQLEFGPRSLFRLALVAPELADEAPLAASGQAQIVGKDSVADEVHAAVRPVQHDVRLQGQTQFCCKEGLHFPPYLT